MRTRQGTGSQKLGVWVAGGGWLGEKKIAAAAAAAVAVDAVILIWLHVLQWPQYVYKKEPTK